MASVERLVTFVDLDEASDSQLSFSARHDVLLADGRRIVLLNDRGWSQSRPISFSDGESPMPREPSSPWEVTRGHIEETARSVVGPDPAYGEYVQAEMDAAHWEYLSAKLEEQGVDVVRADLVALPHEVELSSRLLVRLADRLDWT